MKMNVLRIRTNYNNELNSFPRNVQENNLTDKEITILRDSTNIYEIEFKSEEELENVIKLINSDDNTTVDIIKNIILQLLIEQYHIEELISIFRKNKYLIMYCHKFNGHIFYII